MLVAGCSSRHSGIATPSGTVGKTTTPNDASSVPPVPAPLTVTAFASNPCSLLTPAQVQAIGLTAATSAHRDSTAVMAGCEWDDATAGTGTQLNVDLVTALHHGLADIYVQRHSAAYWQPVTVHGYPGVLTDTVDERPDGTCEMNLGVTNTDVIDLAYQGANTSEPCQKVQVLAAAVVASLKGSS